MKNMLLLNDLNVFYGSFASLKNVSLNIKERETVCILGANGAGKTTLIKAICGIIKPYSGSIEFNGERIEKLPSGEIIEKGICVCPEGAGCFPTMTVEINLMLGAFTRHDNALIQKDYKKIIDLFPILGKRKNQLAGSLSGGERQMLAIGRALMGNPKLLMFDEPSLGLAPLIVKSIYKTLELLKKDEATILLVEQNAAKSLKLSDRGYVMELGQIIISGTSKELLENENVKSAYIST